MNMIFWFYLRGKGGIAKSWNILRVFQKHNSIPFIVFFHTFNYHISLYCISFDILINFLQKIIKMQVLRLCSRLFYYFTLTWFCSSHRMRLLYSVRTNFSRYFNWVTKVIKMWDIMLYDCNCFTFYTGFI
jgi:hypothetical protein